MEPIGGKSYFVPTIISPFCFTLSSRESAARASAAAPNATTRATRARASLRMGFLLGLRSSGLYYGSPGKESPHGPSRHLAQARGRVHRRAAGLARPVRARATPVPRRGDARQPPHAALPALRGPRRGRAQVGRRRSPLHRLLDGTRRVALRAQSARGPRRRA